MCLNNCALISTVSVFCCQTLVTTRLATLREFVFSVALQRGGVAATTDGTLSEPGSRPDNVNVEEDNSVGVVRRSPVPPPSADGRSGGGYKHGRENSTIKAMDGSHDTAVAV